MAASRSAPSSGAPLPSSHADIGDIDEVGAAPVALETEDEPESTTPATPPRPPVPQFKLSTFVLVFLFILGIWMIFETSTREGVAGVFGLGLSPLIGFGHNYLLLTMFFAGIIEMLLTALAYNWATDWVKVAKVQAYSKAFRPLQMKAIRSGKKDRMEAIKPYQQRLTQMSSEVSMAQLKGMAVTWFLVIAIYTWVGLFITAASTSAQTVDLGGASINLLSKIGGLIPYWFLIFSLYTVPFSLLFRRFLKHYTLRKYAANRPRPSALADLGGTGEKA
ncbi:MAG: EMC3/TMCO1 family protein [Thermoplasmata archaeon]